MGKGRTYENGLVNELNRETDHTVRAYPAGFSGVQKTLDCDIVLTTPAGTHTIEAKRRGVAEGELAYIETEQLRRLAQTRNGYTTPWVALSFTNRELLFAQVTVDEFVEVDFPTYIDHYITDSGDSLAVRKPDTDIWPSQQAGHSDVYVIMSEVSWT